MFMAVAPGIRPYVGAFGDPELFQGYKYPIIFFAVLRARLLYHLFVFGIAERRYLTPRTTNLARDAPAQDWTTLTIEPGPLDMS